MTKEEFLIRIKEDEKGNLVFKNYDNTDYSIGVIVGRLPVKNKNEVTTIITKIIQYEKEDSISKLDYFRNYLYSDAYMGTSDGKLSYFGIKQIKDTVNKIIPNLNNRYICDNASCSDGDRYSAAGTDCFNGHTNGDIELNRENLFPDFVIVSPKNFHQRVLQFSDALPSALSVYKLPCSEAA